MNGMTIAEMAAELDIGVKTIEGRIQRGGYKPLTKDAVYSMEVFEAIKNVPGKGRPRKLPEKPLFAHDPAPEYDAHDSVQPAKNNHADTNADTFLKNIEKPGENA